MSRMIITTTDTVEGRSIEKYLGVVNANLVIGTNVFSDFVASFSDFFGGMSGTYRNQLQTLYSKAIKELSEKAKCLGANAVLGLKIDFDEISGKGKSMFMVSIVGTAVKFTILDKTITTINENYVSSEALMSAMFKKGWETRDDNLLPSEEEWEYILSNDIPEIAGKLLSLYIQAQDTKNYDIEGNRQLMTENFPVYFAKIDRDAIVESIYANLSDETISDSVIDKLIHFIIDMNLFNPEQILKLIELGETSTAVALLAANKPDYSEKDLSVMKQILISLKAIANEAEEQNSKPLPPVSEYLGAYASRFYEAYGMRDGSVSNLEDLNMSAISDFENKVNTLTELFNTKDYLD